MSNVTVLQSEDRSEVVLNRLKELSKRVVDDFCEMAELLYETWEHGYHKTLGYDSFGDYTEENLDVKGRKAAFLVNITKTLNRLGIPWDEVREVGWRKTAAIAPVLTRDNAEKWIEEAKITPLAHLSEKVKAEKKGVEPSNDTPIRMTIQIDADEKTIVEGAMDYAKRHEDVTSSSKAIVHICYDYFQSREG